MAMDLSREYLVKAISESIWQHMVNHEYSNAKVNDDVKAAMQSVLKDCEVHEDQNWLRGEIQKLQDMYPNFSSDGIFWQVKQNEQVPSDSTLKALGESLGPVRSIHRPTHGQSLAPDVATPLAAVAGAGLAVAAASVVIFPVLAIAGFSAIGPVAGSAAAAWQASMGATVGGLFSFFQSAAMGGAAATAIASTGAVAGAVGVGAAAGAVVAAAANEAENKKEGDENKDGDEK